MSAADPTGTLLWIDARAGLAGDMLCAALIDAGASLEPVQRQLQGLGLPELSLQTRRVTRGAFSCLHFQVLVAGQAADAQGEWGQDQSEGRAHEHGHSHGHDHSHAHDHSHSHDHRHGPGKSGDDLADGGPGSWSRIRAMLEQAELPEGARSRSLTVFAALAQAEARVHGVPVEQVCFHEVGAADSIADIVGACLLMEQLGVQELVCTELPLGGGMVNTAHGAITAPAPATVALLSGWPCFQDGRSGELVTPTGAAIVASLGRSGPMPSMRPTATGFGAGTWDPAGWGNCVRVVLGQAEGPDRTPTRVALLQTQVDDMRGEGIPALLDALFAAGAVDAYTQPVNMKKGRPGWLLSALAPLPAQAAVARAMLTHSSSFGVRHQHLDRTTLRREHVSVQTPYGAVRVKLGWLGADLLQASPEHRDCARVAKDAGLPLSTVYAAALVAYSKEHD